MNRWNEQNPAAAIRASALLLLWTNRTLLGRMALAEVRERHAGTALGLLWVVLSPLVMLGLYSTIYLGVLRLNPRGVSAADYVLFIFSGLVPFLALSEGLVAGSQSLGANRSILRMNAFPVEILPAKSVLASSISFGIGMAIVLSMAAILGKLTFHVLLVPFVMLGQYLFLLGVAWVLSLVNLALKDIRNLLGYAITVAMILSPIAYRADAIPANLRWILWCNPFAYFITSYQSLISEGRLPALPIMVGAFVLSVGTFAFGYRFFRRLKMGFLAYV